jgi:hypothetical protein
VSTAEADIRGRPIVQALVIASMVVVIDEPPHAGFEITRRRAVTWGCSVVCLAATIGVPSSSPDTKSLASPEYVSPLQAEENDRKLLASLGLNVTRLDRSAPWFLADRFRREAANGGRGRQTHDAIGGIMPRNDAQGVGRRILQ